MNVFDQLLGDPQHLLVDSVGQDRGETVVPVLALLRIGRRIDQLRGEMLRPHALSDGRLGALLVVRDDPGISPARLAQRLEVTRATVTGLLDGLEQHGYVTREADPTDRRALGIAITAAGCSVLDEVIPQLVKWLGACLDDTTASERNVLMQCLQAMGTSLTRGVLA